MLVSHECAEVSSGFLRCLSWLVFLRLNDFGVRRQESHTVKFLKPKAGVDKMMSKGKVRYSIQALVRFKTDNG